MLYMMPEPWEREKGEPRLSFAKFNVFLTLGPHRSLPKLRQALADQGQKRSLTRLKQLSLKWLWFLRAAAYDADIQYQARLAQIEAVREMNRQHVDLARSVRALVARRLGEWLGSAGGLPEQVRFRDLVWAMAEAGKLERLAMGEATARVDLYSRVRELADEYGLSDTEKANAVAAAGRIVKRGA